jgi:hypothetical protein
VAQKLTMTTLPLNAADDTVRPSRSCAVNAGTAAGFRKNRSVAVVVAAAGDVPAGRA